VFKAWFFYVLSVVVVLIIAMARYAVGVTPGHLAVTAPFLLAVLLIAVVWGRGAAIAAALASALAFNYLFIPPPFLFSTPTADEGFLVISLLAVALVVGSWKERTLRVEREVRQLAASEKLQKTLLDTISHDFKTPLTTIVSSLNSLLCEGERLGEGDRRELVEAAYEQATRLSRLVTDVLEMTRLETGAVRLRREPARIGDVVQQALSQVGETMGERPCRITIPSELPSVSMDGILMSHALANLLENAAKYSTPDASIEVEAHTADGDVLIAVADRGIGIPVDELSRIFEKFYRPKHGKVLPVAAGGTGLGLAIAKGIVEAHGGRIWAEQRAAGGVVMKLRLPVEGQ